MKTGRSAPFRSPFARALLTVYNLVWWAVTPFLPALAILARWFCSSGDKKSTLLLPRFPSPSDARFSVWCHAISLGEVTAVAPVIDELMRMEPQAAVYMTVVTETGIKAAKDRLSHLVRDISFAPLDHPLFIRRFLSRIKPVVLLIMESGIWPNMILMSKNSGARTILAQARASRKSIRRWKMLHSSAGQIFGAFDVVTVADERMARELVSLGVRPDRIRIMPSTKFDTLEDISDRDIKALTARFMIDEDAAVFVGGSTHETEERMLASAFLQVKGRIDSAVLIIAPRRPERFERVMEELKEMGLSPEMASRLQGRRSSDIVILDEMGILPRLYSVATACFVGGTFDPSIGGHNILEPASCGVLAVHGPCVRNIENYVRELEEIKAAALARNADEVAELWLNAATNRKEKEDISAAARQWVVSHKGASKKLAQIILESFRDRR